LNETKFIKDGHKRRLKKLPFAFIYGALVLLAFILLELVLAAKTG
jgi:hypothetical protein